MGRPLVVVLLIDALGWEIAERFHFATEQLVRRQPLGTVLGYSAAAIPSLLSGAKPTEHGAWAMWKRAGERSPFGYLKALPTLPHALEWRTRRLVRRLTDRTGRISGYYDLYDIPVRMLAHFDVAQHQDPYVPGGLSRDTVFDDMQRNEVAYRLWYYRTAESENMTQLLDAVGGPEEVLFFYTAELDALMHRVGIFHERVAQRLERYQQFIADIVARAAGEGRDLHLCLLSDHGMTDVDREVDLWGELRARGYRLGRDYLAFYDSTMARLWGGDRVLAAARAVMEESRTGRLLHDEELRSFGCYFETGEYGDHIFLAEPGVMVVPSFMGARRVAAMHGYDPGDRYSQGVFMSNDPDGDLPDSILGFRDYLAACLDGIRA